MDNTVTVLKDVPSPDLPVLFGSITYGILDTRYCKFQRQHIYVKNTGTATGKTLQCPFVIANKYFGNGIFNNTVSIKVQDLSKSTGTICALVQLWRQNLPF
jgi:hypothetical protein